ncbi:phosphoribosyltransferase family protein [Reichenbachiella ulvae]|uniref:Phosphoribosyltransferase family protein n=1 Tax=Reichenbachiella ulvae TaxID=2980104 RepID=A0ABT3CYY8_9BACT|nr:phosphoribosyltransferase family protein [Reichenbachiella ulvae]MCV9388799.1 phosphoribosyltransferase family protein [Reichenbachiella ulvae]
MSKDIILDSAQIDQRIIRIAYQIYENHLEEKHLILAGVSDNGHEFAQMLEKELKKISNQKYTVGKVDINKEAPLSEEIELDLDDKELIKKPVILIDDVLHSGKTAAYALKALLNVNIKKIEVAVMVNRSHKSFPIYPKYSGYELATTMNDHVTVVFKGKEKGVYLS